MLVSMLRPPATAAALAPLPRCSETSLSASRGRPRISAARSVTKSWLVPWKPYRRMRRDR